MNLIRIFGKKYSKKIFRLSLYFILAFSSSPINSCEIKQIKEAHSFYLTKLKLPKNSLLSVSQNEVSIIMGKEIRKQMALTGSNEVKIYQNISNRLVLKAITKIDINQTTLNLLNNLGSPNIQHAIVSQSGVFVFVNKLSPPDLTSCYTKIFYPSSSSKKYYHSFSNTSKKNIENLIFTKNLIISNLLNSNEDFDNFESIISLNLKAHESYKHLAQKIRNHRKTNATAENLVIRPQRAGLQMSEMQIPISAYDRTQKFKDENELFYSTVFKVSKNPKIINFMPTYSFDFGIKENQEYLNINSKFNITEGLNSNIGFKYNNSKLNLNKLNLDFLRLNSENILNSYHFGRFSQLNTGLLFNTQKLNKNESLINLVAYLSLHPDCNRCIRKGLSVGFEQYLTKVDGYTRANLIFQNFKQRSETTLELLLRKPLTNKKQLIIATQYDLANKSPNVFVKLIFPLNSTNKTGSVSYMPKDKDFISNWANDTNRGLLENTPGFLKRNWKNYISF